MRGTPRALHPAVESELLEQIRRLTERLDRLESENAMLRRELERKDRIIESLQKRLFGSTSEKLDPAQLDLRFEEGAPPVGKARSSPGIRRNIRTGGAKLKRRENPPHQS